MLCNIGKEQKHKEVLTYAICRLTKKENELDKDKYYYDLATMKYSLADLLYENKIMDFIDNKEYADIRKNYEKVTTNDLNHFLCARTNTANLFEKYGRNFEAIFAYDSVLKHDPNFGMALGNKAKALIYYFRLSPYKSLRLLNFAKELLKKAVKDQRIIEIVGQAALDIFKYELEKIRKYLKKNNYNEKKHQPHSINAYYKFVLENNLFLNYDFGFYYDDLSLEDSFFPNLIENIHDEKHPNNPWISNKIYICFQTFNQILEDYVSSRFLFYQSLSLNYSKLDRRVAFIYLLDYTKNSTKFGILKKVFANIYNCLDKLAQIVLFYFDIIKTDQNDIYFHSLINEQLKKIIISENNYQLLALLNLAYDFQESYPYYKYRLLRNRITHSFMNINSGILYNNVNCEYEFLEEELIKYCKELFLITKAAIMYFILYFIHNKRNDDGDDKKLIISMEATMQRDVY